MIAKGMLTLDGVAFAGYAERDIGGGEGKGAWIGPAVSGRALRARLHAFFSATHPTCVHSPLIARSSLRLKLRWYAPGTRLPTWPTLPPATTHRPTPALPR